MTALLECVGLTKTYRVRSGPLAPARDLKAVQGVDLALEKGETLAIVGESGSGKSTLGRMLMGALPVSAGEVRLDGKPIADTPRVALARRIQPIYQDPYSSLNPRKTLAEIVGMPLAVHNFGTAKERLAKVEEMLDQVGLATRLVHSYPDQLSGGQRQRAAIARALVLGPEILVCDEPTSALDVSVQAQILNLLIELRERLGLTCLFISHDLGVVEYIAHRVAVMYLGRIVEQGNTLDVLRNPRHPYSKALLGAVLSPDPSLDLPDLQLGRGIADPLNPPSGCHFHPRCPAAFEGCDKIDPPVYRDAAGMVRCRLYPATAT